MKFLEDARFMRRFHFAMLLFWLVAILPTLIWLKESILWVALMSVWANIAAHFAAWQAAHGEEAHGRR